MVRYRGLTSDPAHGFAFQGPHLSCTRFAPSNQLRPREPIISSPGESQRQAREPPHRLTAWLQEFVPRIGFFRSLSTNRLKALSRVPFTMAHRRAGMPLPFSLSHQAPLRFKREWHNTGQSNTEDKHLDSDFRRKDLKMLCIVNKVIPAKLVPGLNREPGRSAIQAMLPGVIEQLR